MSKATRIKRVRRSTLRTAKALAVPYAVITLLFGALSLASGSPRPILAITAAFVISALIIICLQEIEVDRIKRSPMP